MKKFAELDKRSVHEIETDILATWKKKDILNKLLIIEKIMKIGYFMMAQQRLMECQVFIIW